MILLLTLSQYEALIQDAEILNPNTVFLLTHDVCEDEMGPVIDAVVKEWVQ